MLKNKIGLGKIDGADHYYDFPKVHNDNIDILTMKIETLEKTVEDLKNEICRLDTRTRGGNEW
jgi:hypothetical protein